MLPIPGTRDEAIALRSMFELGGLTTTGLAEAFGLDDGDRCVLLGPRAVPSGPASPVVRLWFQGEEVDAGAIDGLAVGRLEELGLVEIGGDVVRSDLRVTPLGGHWFIGDRGGEHIGDMPADHVLGPSASALTLTYLTIRRPAALALDLGTGCGVHALLAAAHHERVVATDISTRALALGRWAAWLNDVDNIEWREGDLFEPVASERFDLIVSSPPFVISPDVASSFRDGGSEGDDLCRAMAEGAGRHLTPGGVGTVLLNWGCSADEDDATAPLGWVDDDIDALCLVHRVDSPSSYASRWAEPVAATPAQHRELVERWTATYASAGWNRLGSGALVLRRPASGPRRWALALETPSSGLGAAGDQLAGILARLDAVAGGIGDATVIDTAPFVVDQELAPVAGGGLRPIAASARLGGGLPFTCELDHVGLAVLAGADGRRTVNELCAGVAAELGAPVDAVDEHFREVVAKLLTLGFLVPVGPT